MKHITDCPLCELRFHREHEVIYHLRTDHDGERSATLADLMERTTRERRAERRRRARGAGTRARATDAQVRDATADDAKRG
jgi:exopolysaccharide biosynthesis predicted pyruvyltransferase EpsI